MKPLVADGENARVYPQKYHWKMTTALLAATAQIKDTEREMVRRRGGKRAEGKRRVRALFRRDRPEYRKADR